MDSNKLIQRARSVLVSPQTEWPVIAAEPATVADVYRDYVLFMAAIPPVCGFIKTSLIGYAWHSFTLYRLGIGPGLTAAIVAYASSLASIYILGIIIDALAPSFGGQQSRVQAIKVAAYSSTAIWVAGLGLLLPALSVLVEWAGVIYSVYLLYLGLPYTMRVTPGRHAGYAAVIVIIALVIGWIIGLITSGIGGVPVGIDT
jgi:hypothetical protein